MSELDWGILAASYLFFGGMAGGAYVVGALADLFKKGKYKVLSKSGVLVSLFSILIGLVVLVLDLKRFEVAPLGILNVYRNFPGSILTVGTWIISGFIVISLVTVVLWFLDGWSLVRKLVEIVGIILGISTAAYTGLLLAFSRGRPFWTSPYLPWTFVISGILTGLALALFMIPIFAVFMPRIFGDFKKLFSQKKQLASMYGYCQSYFIVLIAIELVLVVIEVGTGHGHAAMLLTGAGLSLMFYAYLILGLVAPLVIIYYTLKLGTGSEIWMIFFSMGSFVLVLIGGFLLRYVILTAGQLIF
jgi:polysulfide reductase chain C